MSVRHRVTYLLLFSFLVFVTGSIVLSILETRQLSILRQREESILRSQLEASLLITQEIRREQIRVSIDQIRRGLQDVGVFAKLRSFAGVWRADANGHVVLMYPNTERQLALAELWERSLAQSDSGSFFWVEDDQLLNVQLVRDPELWIVAFMVTPEFVTGSPMKVDGRLDWTLAKPSDETTEEIRGTMPLADFRGETVAYCSLSRPSLFVRDLGSLLRGELLLFAGCSLVVVFVLSFGLRSWIIRPLGKIAESLRTDRTGPVRDLQKDQGEFAAIAQLVDRFLEQRTFLIEEVERRMRSEKSLKRSESDYRELFENAQDAMVIADAKTTEILTINVSGGTVYGVPHEQLVGQTIRKLWKHDLDFSRWWQDLMERVTSKGVEAEHQRTDGRALIVEINAAQIAYRDRKSILLVIRDITEEKVLEDMRLSHAIWQHIPKIALVMDQTGQVTFVTGNVESVLGYRADELYDDGWYRVAAEDPLTERARMMRIASGEEVTDKPVERRVIRKDGTTGWLLWFEVRAPGGIVICVGHDETEQRLARQAVEQSEDRYRRLFDENPTPLLILDLEGNAILSVNRAAVEMYGYSREDFARLRFSDLLVGTGDHLPAGLQQHKKKDESVVDVQCTYQDVGWGQTQTKLALILDVSQQVRAQEAEFELQKQKIRIAAMVEAVEEERRRISKEMHDSVGQMLSAVKRDLELFQKSVGRTHAQRMESIQNLIQTAIHETRQIAYNLMPAALEHLGLLYAVESLCEQVRRHTGLKIHFKTHEWNRRWPPSLELAFFRIIQETLTNVVKHAHATEVQVQMIGYPDKLMVLIEDNGVGFQKTEDKRVAAPAMGLVSLRERAAMHGGVVHIDSQKGRGTSVIVEIPVGETIHVEN